MSINSETPRLNPLGQAVLGGISSFLINGVIHPISTIQSCIMANPLSTVRTLRQMNFSSLYRGYWAICGTDSVAFAAAYVTNDAFRDCFSQLTASILAGIVCAPVICLGEGLARNRQVNGMRYSEVFQRAIRPTGLAATAFREIPFTVAVFWLTPLLQKELPTPSSIVAQAVAGTLAGSIAGLATSPFDLIKTRVQTNERPLTIANVVCAVYVEKGWQGFFRGGVMRALYVGLAGAGMNIVNNTVPHYLAKDLQTALAD